MRVWIVVALIAAVGLVASAAEEDGVVISLTNETFGKVREGVWFVKFFVSWCGHCRTLAPKWEELAKIAAGRYHIAEVNCAEYRPLCESEEVRFYPTLKLYKEGREEPFVYDGPREVEPLNDFVEYSVDIPYPPEEKTAEKMLRRAELLALRAKNTVSNLESLIVRGEEAMKSTERRILAHNLEQRGRKTRVEMLTEEDFDRAYHGAWMIRFMKPTDKPEDLHTEMWDDLAERYGWVFHVADVDCEADANLCKLENIENTPSFVMYLEGTIGPVVYKDEITADGISNLVFDNIDSIREYSLTPEEIDEQVAYLREYMKKYMAEQEGKEEGEEGEEPQEEQQEEMPKEEL